MALPFDATLKEIVAGHTQDYEAALDLPAGPAGVLNVDLSTLSAATDVALGYGDPVERVVDINFQASFAEKLPRRLLLYSAAFHLRYNAPVHSVVVLLRPAADAPNLTGQISYAALAQRGKVDFTYEVVRLWQRPVEAWLRGGLGTLPLAPLCQLPAGVPAEDALRQVIREIADRVRAEASPEEAAKLLMATYVLTGLRVARGAAEPLFEGVGLVEESSTYQLIVEKGEIKHAKKLILLLGSQRLGAPDEATRQALQSITDLERLDRIAAAVYQAANWQELLATA